MLGSNNDGNSNGCYLTLNMTQLIYMLPDLFTTTLATPSLDLAVCNLQCMSNQVTDVMTAMGRLQANNRQPLQQTNHVVLATETTYT